MDGITQALQAIQPALKPATEIAGIGSTAYNMYNQYQNQQYQNNLRSYAQDPAKMNAYAAQFTQPLTAGLTKGVANQAQSDLATRGLTDSPEISQQVYAQAIAPYIQQNQNQGYQNALQALQVGGGAVNPNLQSSNSIAALAKMFAGQPGGANPLPPQFTPQQIQQLRGVNQPMPDLSAMPFTPVPGYGAPPIDSSMAGLQDSYMSDPNSYASDSGGL